MKKLLLLAIAVLATASLAADTIKIKFEPLVALNAALHDMDGADKAYENVAIQNGTATRILKVPYDLKTPVRLAIARDITAVRVVLDAFEQRRQRALNDASPGNPDKVQTDQVLLGKFMIAWNLAIAEPVAVELSTITEDDLNLEKNKEITGSTLSGLSPILTKK